MIQKIKDKSLKRKEKELADKRNFKFYETSAVNRKNIEKTFNDLAKMIIDSGNLSSSNTRTASMLYKEIEKKYKGKKSVVDSIITNIFFICINCYI